MGQAEAMIIRKELLDRLSLELIGPNSEAEVLEETPTQRYMKGILWPAGSQVEEEDDEDMGAGNDSEDQGVTETPAPLMQAMKPSSAGLSFVVDHKTPEIKVIAKWGTYEKTLAGARGWSRQQHLETVNLNLFSDQGVRNKLELQPDSCISLEWICRPLGEHLAVSLFIVNRKEVPENAKKDPYCIFQPELTVTGVKSGIRPFLARTVTAGENDYRPPDLASDDLLYRDNTVFATGHGISSDWDDISSDKLRAGLIRTVTMPNYEVPRVIPPAWNKEGSLDMDVLASAPDGPALNTYLSPLCDEYSIWIKRERAKASVFSEPLKSTAERHLGDCEISLARMKSGLALVSDSKNKDVFLAFQFMNRVMMLQRTYSIWAKYSRKENKWTEKPNSVKSEWRPFQMAFILQALDGVVDPVHQDRTFTDLLWFPTGGGKTEAYLGLASFTIALRRLRGNTEKGRRDAGVNVLMRYTLRLLTIQQFQRAATLICACEILRIQNPEIWGEEPFRIGLWVGSNSTPNDFDTCYEILNERQYNGKSTPVQLLSCPWCGSPLSKRDYFADKRIRRLIIGCSRKECEFHRSKNRWGIPALVTDEEIYRLLPTLLIGTVDKFARMPWVGEIQALFGQVRGFVDSWGFVSSGDSADTVKSMKDVINRPVTFTDNRPLLPPELIIQDELHLIAGPLGSMVGLYESAVEWLCTGEYSPNGPKVIASTATIRRASYQVSQLFNRKLAIFPSPGIDSGDSFFAEEQPLSEKPGRIYAGIFAPGRSIKTALVRVYAALLASSAAICASAEDIDPYHTLVGYFNSLRELGGAVRLTEDDVPARIRVLANRTAGRYRYSERKIQTPVPELTSRADSKDIPAILDSLERSLTGDSPRDGVKPVDVVLASNMISVGVDIPRLGLMVVSGQPKASAEYIQATSRVGREYPGLVITVYNWARPRDMSHYEQFRAYHASVYRYVESISVTPFSSRARDRALPATFVSMCRLRVPGMAENAGASRFRADQETVNRIREYIMARVRSTDGSARAAEVETELRALNDRWERAVRQGNLTYQTIRRQSPNLLYQLGNKQSGTFGTPNSMRDVETPIGVYLRREGT